VFENENENLESYLYPVNYYFRGENSSFCIAMNYGLKRPGKRIPVGAKFFTQVQNGNGVQPTSSTMGTGSLPVVKRPRSDAEHPLLVALRSESVRLYLYPILGLRVCYGVPLNFPNFFPFLLAQLTSEDDL
jgi:hypothetical protein